MPSNTASLVTRWSNICPVRDPLLRRGLVTATATAGRAVPQTAKATTMAANNAAMAPGGARRTVNRRRGQAPCGCPEFREGRSRGSRAGAEELCTPASGAGVAPGDHLAGALAQGLRGRVHRTGAPKRETYSRTCPETRLPPPLKPGCTRNAASAPGRLAFLTEMARLRGSIVDQLQEFRRWQQSQWKPLFWVRVAGVVTLWAVMRNSVPTT